MSWSGMMGGHLESPEVPGLPGARDEEYCAETARHDCGLSGDGDTRDEDGVSGDIVTRKLPSV